MMHSSIYIFESLFSHEKKVVKVIFFTILKLDDDHCKGFLRCYLSSDSIISIFLIQNAIFLKKKQTSEVSCPFFLSRINFTVSVPT